MSGSTWQGKRALITGASAGIGAEFARQLAAAGADLILTARRTDRLEALAKDLQSTYGVDVAVFSADLAANGGPAGLAEAIEAADLNVDVLVNNAGLGFAGKFVEHDWHQEQMMLRVNIEALVELSHRFAPGMVARGWGRILLIGSVLGHSPTPLFASYAATKAYVKRFGEALGHELRGTGVAVTVVHPGGTRSEFMDTAGMTLDKMAELAMMDAKDVVSISLRKSAKGRLSVITGLMNVVFVVLFSVLPRALVLRIGHSIYKGMLPS